MLKLLLERAYKILENEDVESVSIKCKCEELFEELNEYVLLVTENKVKSFTNNKECTLKDFTTSLQYSYGYEIIEIKKENNIKY